MEFVGYARRDDVEVREIDEDTPMLEHLESAGVELMTEDDVSDEYRDLLDECYPTVEVAGATFYPSDILKNCDPIAYRVGLSDYISEYFVEVLG